MRVQHIITPTPARRSLRNSRSARLPQTSTCLTQARGQASGPVCRAATRTYALITHLGRDNKPRNVELTTTCHFSCVGRTWSCQAETLRHFSPDCVHDGLVPTPTASLAGSQCSPGLTRPDMRPEAYPASIP